MKKPKIKYSLTYIMFKNWLKINQHRFPAMPQITRLERDSFFLVFSRVKNLGVIFRTSGMIVASAWKNKNFEIDILIEFDLYESKNEQGYYCTHCLERKYFQDRNTLWINHVYEPLLEWTLEKFKSENYLCLYEQDPGGSSYAKISTLDQIKKDKDSKYKIYCGPIIEQEKRNET